MPYVVLVHFGNPDPSFRLGPILEVNIRGEPRFSIEKTCRIGSSKTLTVMQFLEKAGMTANRVNFPSANNDVTEKSDSCDASEYS